MGQPVSRRAALAGLALVFAGCAQPSNPASEDATAAYEDAEVSAIDEEILDLIEARMAIADEIGIVKAEEGLPVEVPEQEEVVLDRVAGTGEEAGADPELVRAVFRELIEMSKDVQERHVD